MPKKRVRSVYEGSPLTFENVGTMANSTPSDSPLSDDFDHHCLRIMNPQTACLHIHRETGSVTVGSVNGHSSHSRVQVVIKNGRFMDAGFEITIEALRNGQSSTPRPNFVNFVIDAIDIEHGTSNKTCCNNLQWKWLGKSSGGGSMYAKAPPDVRTAKMEIKRRTLEVKVLVTGYVCSNKERLDAVMSAAGANSNIQKFFGLLRGDELFLTLYLVFPAFTDQRKAFFETQFMKPLQQNVHLRVQPYQQYLPADQKLVFGMGGMPGFKNSIFCGTLGDPRATYHALSSRGRKQPLQIAWSSARALIAEEEYYERFLDYICAKRPQVRLQQTSQAVLGPALRSFPHGSIQAPAMNINYLAYVKLQDAHPQEIRPNISILRFGEVFKITFKPRQSDAGALQVSNEVAFGTVLFLEPGTRQDAHFVLGIVFGTSKETMMQTRSDAYHPVQLTPVANLKPQKKWLSAMQTFSESTIPVANFQIIFRVRDLVLPQFGYFEDHNIDLRDGREQDHSSAAASANRQKWNSSLQAVFQAMISFTAQIDWSTPMINSQETILLRTAISTIKNGLLLLRADLNNQHVRTVAGLALLMSSVGHKIILVEDDSERRSKLGWLLAFMLRGFQANSPSGSRPMYVLHYTTTDIETTGHHDFQERASVDLHLKTSFDGLAEHQVNADTGNWHAHINANPPQLAPRGHIPQTFSLDDHVASLIRIGNPQRRAQYYQDRAVVLNSTTAPGPLISQIKQRRSQIVGDVIRNTNILLTDSKTAVSDPIKNAYIAKQSEPATRPVVFLLTTDVMTFPTAAAVLLAYPQLLCSIICGHSNPPSEQGNPRRMYLASRDRKDVNGNVMEVRNECIETLELSLWQMAVDAGGQVHTLE